MDVAYETKERLNVHLYDAQKLEYQGEKKESSAHDLPPRSTAKAEGRTSGRSTAGLERFWAVSFPNSMT